MTLHRTYYSTDLTPIIVATPTKPGSPDEISINGSTGYQAHRINNTLKRNASQLTVINDGTTTLYMIVSPDGKIWSESENPLLIGESRTFYNVYEIRLRSTEVGSVNGSIVSGGVYRLTEYEIKTSYSGSSAYSSGILGSSSANPNLYFFGAPFNAKTDSTITLGINATFYGVTQDFLYSRLGFIGAIAFSNVASAASGFRIQQSIDGTNWDFDGDAVSLLAGVGIRTKSAIVARYARVAYTNGIAAQTTFRIGSRSMIS